MEVQARVGYYLSELGRKDSLVKGGDGKREQVLAGFITNPEDLELFEVEENGQVLLYVTKAFVDETDQRYSARTKRPSDLWGRREIEWHIVPSWEDLLSVARSQEERRVQLGVTAKDIAEEEERAAADPAVEVFLADPTLRAERIEEDWVRIGGHDYWGESLVAVEAKQRAARDLEELRTANRITLTAFIQEHGTENQRQRLAAQLLPWDEAYAALADHLYAALGECPLYQRFDIKDVCVCWHMGKEACDIKFRSVDATTLTAQEWEQLAKIRSAVPDATFQLREHTARCASDDKPQLRRGVIVKLAFERLTFKREFAL